MLETERQSSNPRWFFHHAPQPPPFAWTPLVEAMPGLWPQLVQGNGTFYDVSGVSAIENPHRWPSYTVIWPEVSDEVMWHQGPANQNWDSKWGFITSHCCKFSSERMALFVSHEFNTTLTDTHYRRLCICEFTYLLKFICNPKINTQSIFAVIVEWAKQ